VLSNKKHYIGKKQEKKTKQKNSVATEGKIALRKNGKGNK